MIGLKQMLLEEEKQLSELIAELESHSFPEGSLRISTRRKKPRYYQVTAGHPQYISVSNKELPQLLAQKEYEKKLLLLAQRRYRQICRILTDYEELEMENIYHKQNIARQKLIKPIVPTWDQYVEEWMALEYPKLPRHQENLILQTNNGIWVRSKTEKILADRFEGLHIPYHYEMPLQLKGYHKVHPDFTTLSLKYRKVYYWEHLGMMDNPQYAAHAVEKINAYENAGIYPGEQLILTYETSNVVLSMKTVNDLIYRYLI